MKLDITDGGVYDKAAKVKFVIGDLSKAGALKKSSASAEPRAQKSTNPSTIYEFNESSKRSDAKPVALSSSVESSICAGEMHAGSRRQRTHDAIVYRNLTGKYVSTRESYNMKIINDILGNEATHTVSSFKEFLIYDDVDEFLKRLYSRNEADKRVKYQTVWQNRHAKVFPVYVILEEKKYMFKNIRKKQKVIDRRNGNLESLSVEESKLFTRNFMHELDKTDSVLGKTLRKLKNELENNSLMLSCVKPKKEAINLEELVNEFILKDTFTLPNNEKENNPKHKLNTIRSKSKDFLKLNKVHIAAAKKNKPNVRKSRPFVFAGRSKSAGKLLTEVKTPLQLNKVSPLSPPNKLTRVQTVLDIKSERKLSVNKEAHGESRQRNSASAKTCRGSCKPKSGQTPKTKPKLKGKIMKDQYFSNRNNAATSRNVLAQRRRKCRLA
eukprot:TRINITY_DN2246_c0_g10_i1.p1 TRINITY_DN2246_c0_g10~~TRINITY_DN2246_c0_g10_i1.p1  ORF type:complete len:439 (-),score=116.07 TRINITY_DN2246_c0_g10_i1:438-1754(-)